MRTKRLEEIPSKQIATEDEELKELGRYFRQPGVHYEYDSMNGSFHVHVPDQSKFDSLQLQDLLDGRPILVPHTVDADLLADRGVQVVLDTLLASMGWFQWSCEEDSTREGVLAQARRALRLLLVGNRVA